MSLTSHLNTSGSPIGEFLRTRFAQTANITKEANPKLRAATCLHPYDVPGENYPYGTIGHAIDYRMRYTFALTPVDKTVAYNGAVALANRTSEDRFGGYLVPATLEARQLPLDTFFALVDAEVARILPIQRTLAVDDERRLCQLCFVLSLFEEVYRSGQPSAGLELFARKWLSHPKVQGLTDSEQQRFTNELLALVKPIWVDDIRQMINLFLERGRWLFNRPFALNPLFAGSADVNGADADLIVDGCLIDIKSSKLPRLDPMDMRQLVGYILLDYTDEHSIRSVAIYKARYGLTFTWPVEEFLSRLAGHPVPPLADLRAEFQELCQQHRRAMRGA